MAAWGTGLYQDDIAEDVKIDYYNCFRQDGLDNEAAYEKMLSKYSEIEDDPEDGPVFWMVLADLMWNLGKLTEEVKEQALYHIGTGRDVERWEEEDRDKAAKRRQVLEKLKDKLESPMPKEKKLRKKRILKNKWQIGDMYIMPVEKSYPRFPEMKVKYLLLIKVDERRDLTDNIQPVVYIKYLEEEYREGMDINALEFARCLQQGFYFIIAGIAGRPKPKELTFVGNYGDISGLERPIGPEENVEQLTCNSIWYVRALEHSCISSYFLDVLGVDVDAIASRRMYMTEEEYQEDCRREQAYKQRLLEERKAGEYYICPWEDGDTFYMPLREEVKGSRRLSEHGYVGTVMVKVGVEEGVVTTNLWPVMLMCCVKKEYTDIQSLIRDDIFNQSFLPLQVCVSHGRDESMPESLRKIGNITDISAHCNRKVKIGTAGWSYFENCMVNGL